jgi:hypothetical protein
MIETNISAEDMEHAEEKMRDFLSELPWPLITNVNLWKDSADEDVGDE